MRTPLEYFALALTLDGVDEEAGDVEQVIGWNGLVRAPVVPSVEEMDPALRAMWDDLDSNTQRELQHQKGGMIVSQDSQGFVYVEMFDDDRDIKEAWLEIQTDALDDDALVDDSEEE